MKIYLLILAVLLPLCCKAQGEKPVYDPTAAENYIKMHKQQRTLLLARSGLEQANKTIHEELHITGTKYKEMADSIDKYRKAFDILDLCIQSLKTGFDVYNTFTSVSDGIQEYVRLMNIYKQECLARGNINADDLEILAIFNSALSDTRDDIDEIYASVVDIIGWATARVPISSPVYLQLVIRLDDSLDDLRKTINGATRDMRRYLTIRLGYYKKGLHRQRAKIDIARDAFGRWHTAGRLDLSR